ncbi:MAG: nucleoside hydrolase, partial [Thermoguttaceae bacterium]|nr:nucleoside hydrolase [Thermoguttaceae bacterium]
GEKLSCRHILIALLVESLAVVLLGLLNLGRVTHAADDGARPRLFAEFVSAQARPASAPMLSGVCFSSRWVHPTGPSDPFDTFQIAEQFAATDFVWTYSLDPEFVKRAKQFGGRVFLAINSLVPDEPDGNTRRRGRIVDLNGNPVTAPWMRSSGERWWGCVNSPEYRASYLGYAKRCIDAGCDGLQMDDPLTNLHAVQWGACFCEHCMVGFRQFLLSQQEQLNLAELGISDLTSFDYRQYLREQKAPVGDAFRQYHGGKLKELFVQFQRQSVERFFHDMRAAIDAYAGRHVPFASNNYRGSWDFPYDLFEIGMAELPQKDATPANMYRLFSEARQRRKHQIFTLVPAAADGSEVHVTRCAIATSYACGGHLIVPWDVYTGPNKPRYFGKPEQYADLYQFVRRNQHLFDGFQEVAARIPGELSSDEIIWHIEGGNTVLGVLRAKPGDSRCGVVIHLVDWAEKPAGLTLWIDSRPIGRPMTATLYRPGQKPEDVPVLWGRHMIEEVVALTLPALDPWGVIWLRPTGDKTEKQVVPIVYSTDLYHPHDDPDDHFDLATLFSLPEFDIRGIILDGGRRQKERPGAIPVEQMLKLTNRQVPVAIGLADPLRGPNDDGSGQPPEFQAGVNLLLEILEKSQEKVTVFTTGSLRDMAAAYLRRPELCRQKINRLYINIGDALGGQEYNVNLDPWAYRIIMRSDLPLYWCPCFAGGLWKREKGLATYWRFRQGQVLANAPLPIVNFFLYALRQEKTPALGYLSARHPEDQYQWLFALERNMWCTAPFLHAAGRHIWEVAPGKFAVLPTSTKPEGELGKGGTPGFPRLATPFRFQWHWVKETPDGQFTVCEAPAEPADSLRKIHCFEIVDLDRYDAIMTDVLTELFCKFALTPPQ